jgi:hypothetical protein
MQGLIDSVNLAASSDICLYGFHEPGQSGDITLLNASKNSILLGYENEIKKLANVNSCSRFNIRAIAPNRLDGHNLDYWLDAIHFNGNGVDWLLKKIVAFLSIPFIDNSEFITYPSYFSKDIFINKDHVIGYWKYTNGVPTLANNYIKFGDTCLDFYIGGTLKRRISSTTDISYQPILPKPYSKSSLPDITTFRDSIILVYDDPTGRVLAYSDGINWVRVTDGLPINSPISKYDSVSMLDSNMSEGAGSYINLAASKSGFGRIIIGNAQEYSDFVFKVDGTVTLINNSANVVSTSIDGKLVIRDAGTNVRIINELGSTLIATIIVNYNT